MYLRKALCYLLVGGSSLFCPLHGERSIHRPRNPLHPTVTIAWHKPVEKQKTAYTLTDAHIHAYPFFQIFDKKHFFHNLLPDKPISYRYAPEKSVKGRTLKTLIEKLIKELYHYGTLPTELKNFIVLKQRDYDPATHTGLIILKFKKYPFVVKLFMKTPQTLAEPFYEGLESNFFYIMGGGVNRFFSGFTRIKNLEAIRKRIAQNDYWSSIIDTPRKWFWHSKQTPLIEISATNLGGKQHQNIIIPSVYGLICDAIDAEYSFSLWDAEQRSCALQLCEFLQSRIDAHIDNFMKEKGTGKIVVVDSEHFPSMVGLRECMSYSSYGYWFAQLSWKCFCDKFFQSKALRRQRQQGLDASILSYEITD